MVCPGVNAQKLAIRWANEKSRRQPYLVISVYDCTSGDCNRIAYINNWYLLGTMLIVLLAAGLVARLLEERREDRILRHHAGVRRLNQHLRKV